MSDDDKAARVRGFHTMFQGEDNESLAVRAELARLFPRIAKGTLRTFEDDTLEDIDDTLTDLTELVRSSETFEAAPPALRELATFLIYEDYVNGTQATKMENQSLYGVFDFDEINGPEGILGDMKVNGHAPAGVFCIGENVFVDTRGEIGSRAPGAVYKTYSFDLDGVEPIAPSVSAFLARCG